MTKKIGIMTTGGDCSGLNTAIARVEHGALLRGWQVIGLIDGADGLASGNPEIIGFDWNTLPVENMRLAGSFLKNGHPRAKNFATMDDQVKFNAQIKKSIESLGLDAVILIGGNGSLSLAHLHRDIYANTQLICIPKTIDLDIPLTDRTIGFDTAVQQLTSFCDQLLLTARSHHRWFVVQAMGRDCGALALNAGIAVGADAIIIPEIRFNTDDLIRHIKNTHRDYGIIMVSEGIKMRGHSGRPADMISRELTRADIINRSEFPEHMQRAGDTTSGDRIIATSMADCALNAIENNETYVMTTLQNGIYKTIPLSEFYNNGHIICDAKILGCNVSNSYVSPDDPLLSVANNMGIYIGKAK